MRSAQLALQQITRQLGVGLSFTALHHLADEEAERLLLPGAVLRDGVRVLADDVANDGEQRVLITVKTYPTLSRKYGETVCTAGVREDGSWVRIYPVPFRRLNEEQQYRKYDWLEARLVRNTSDPRPETFRPSIQPTSSGRWGTSAPTTSGASDASCC